MALDGRNHTLLELRYRVRNLLGEQTIDPTTGLPAAEGPALESVYWPAEEIDRYINDAYIEAAKATKCLEIIESVATTADTATYTLSSNVGQVFRVSYDDRKIQPITKWELDRTEPNWENLSGYVSNYMLTQMNNRRIRLFKAPEEGGGLVESGGEYGLVTDIDDGGTNTYTFSDEYGLIVDTDGTNWDGDFIGEYGLMTITGGTSNNLEVWATKHPSALVLYSAQPELPPWSHMGIAFRAAAKALAKYGEQADAAKMGAYNAIADDYQKLLRGLVGNRSGERSSVMGRARNKQRRPEVWETEVIG